MKKIFFSLAVLFSALTVSAQNSTRPPQGQVSITPNGKVYGEKVDVKTAHPIGDMEAYFGRRTSITTTISGKVVDVDKNGNFFTIKDNKGRPVTVRFKNAGYKLPQSIKGKNVLIDGVISKQFITNNRQHYAGSNAGMDKTNQKNNNSGSYEMAARGVQLLD
jgi:hypothetical protein